MGVMRVDIATHRQFIILSIVCVLIVVIAVIVGSTGPSSTITSDYSVYQCENGGHNWNDKCKGVQLNKNGSVGEVYVNPLLSDNVYSKITVSNRFYVVTCEPYVVNSSNAISDNLNIIISLLGSNDEKTWYYIRANESQSYQINCEKGSTSCDRFLIIFEESFSYSYYKYDLYLDHSNPLSNNIGDVVLNNILGNHVFTNLEIGFRVFFVFVSIILLVYYLIVMRRVQWQEWTFEQKCVGACCISLILYNDPFYSFAFSISGWFFPFLQSLFETLFMCVLILMWILHANKIRKEEMNPVFTVWYIPIIVILLIYAILSVVLFSWINIRDSEDPLFHNSINTVVVLFYLATTSYTLLIVYLVALSSLAIPVLENKIWLRVRYLFFVIPAIVIVLSIIVTIFTGTFGPFNRSSFSLVYFMSLYNVYIFVLIWGYSPTEHERFAASNPSEGSRLIFSDQQ